MTDIVWIVLAGLLWLVGAVGSVAPIIPGLPLCWAGLLLLKFIPSTGDNITWTTIALLGGVTAIITILDNILPVWGTKKMGGNKRVVWGATIGLLIGFFFAPWGIVLGPFVGALIGGLVSGTRLMPATKQATGAFVGYLSGLLLKLVTAGVIAFFFVRTVIA